MVKYYLYFWYSKLFQLKLNNKQNIYENNINILFLSLILINQYLNLIFAKLFNFINLNKINSITWLFV